MFETREGTATNSAPIDIGKAGIWQANFDGLPAAEIAKAVKKLEGMGWKCIWSPEALGRDVLITSSIILNASKKLHAATGIAQIHARHPMTMAGAQKALAQAHQNRFLLGLGVSHAPFIEGVRKLSYEKPLSYMESYLKEMREAVYMSVEPSQTPPVFLAALGPKMLELAASKADGAHPYNTLPSHTESARKIMGKDAFLAPEQKVIFETDPQKARETARASIGFYMELPNYINNFLRMGFTEADIKDVSDRFIDGLFSWGDMDAIKNRITEHLEAGADHVAIQVISAPDAKGLPMAEWKALAKEYF